MAPKLYQSRLNCVFYEARAQIHQQTHALLDHAQDAPPDALMPDDENDDDGDVGASSCRT